MLVVLCSGCHRDRSALADYLTELSRMCRGSKSIFVAFSEILEGSEPGAARASALQTRVIAPYRSLVEQLETYEPEGESIRRYHTSYLAIARRQLSGFKAAEAALRDGRSLQEVSVILDLARGDMATWVEQIGNDAEELGLTLSQ